MLKRFLPLSKQFMLAVNNSLKLPYIYKMQILNQSNLNKTYYNFCQNHKIPLEEGIDHIRSIQEQIEALNDLQVVFNNQFQIIEYLEDNLQNFDDKFINVVYIEEILVLHWYQVAIYAYLKQQNPLNMKLTQKLMNCDLISTLDIIQLKKFLEPKDVERLKIKLKAASIMCHIINYGVEADLNQLHDWMNDYLDQLEMYSQLSLELLSLKNKGSKDSPTYRELNDFSINFYFLIAQIFRKRNLIEEFERFIDQGIEEVKSQADKIIQIRGGQFELDLILVNLFELFLNFKQAEDIKSEYTKNYAIKIVDFASNYWEDSCELYILEIKVVFAQFFISNNLFEKAAVLLQQVYEVNNIIVEDNTLFLLYSNIYHCHKQGLLKNININLVINQANELDQIDLGSLIIQVLDFNMCIFDDILETKDLDKIKVGFEKVIYYIYELSKLIKENKFQASIPIFVWIDQVMANNLLKNNDQFILLIYNALNQFKDIELEIDRQNLEKDFYLIVLAFKLKDKINLSSQQKLKSVEEFAMKYISNQEMQNIAINKLLLFNFQLIEEGKLKECQDIIDLLIEILSKGKYNLNKFVQQFQNQKNSIIRIKKNQ